MAMDMIPAVRQVTVSVGANGNPLPSSPGTPTYPSTIGFTKMMYAITMKVVIPARISVAVVVLCVWGAKKRSSGLGMGGAIVLGRGSFARERRAGASRGGVARRFRRPDGRILTEVPDSPQLSGDPEPPHSPCFARSRSTNF